MRPSLRIAALLLALTLGPIPLLAQSPAAPSFEEFRAADPDQKQQILVLEEQIYQVARTVEGYYKWLVKLNLVDKNQQSTIPLVSEPQANWGTRRRDVYNETAVIQWDGARIAFMQVRQRRAIQGTTYILNKHWFVQEIGRRETRPETTTTGKPEDVVLFDGLAINLVVSEDQGSASEYYYNYRYFTGRDARNRDQDVAPPVTLLRQNVPVYQVREPRRRIQLLRQHLAHMRLLERRINYLAYSFTRAEDSLLDE